MRREGRRMPDRPAGLDPKWSGRCTDLWKPYFWRSIMDSVKTERIVRQPVKLYGIYDGTCNNSD